MNYLKSKKVNVFCRQAEQFIFRNNKNFRQDAEVFSSDDEVFCNHVQAHFPTLEIMVKFCAAFILFTCLFSTNIFGQASDTTIIKKAQAALPMLGNIYINGSTSSLNANGNKISVTQAATDINIPLYKHFMTKRPSFMQLLLHYDGLFISDNPDIKSNNFHTLSATLMQTISTSPTRNLTFIALGSVGSDFRQNFDGHDMMYGAGIRMGFRQNSKLKYGVTLMYFNAYSGQFLIPLPDLNWQISDRWNFTLLAPVAATLKYKISNQQSIGVATGFNSGLYRLNDSIGHKQYLQYQQFNAGFVYDISLGKHWNININAGRTLGQRLETFSDDQKVSLDDFKSLKNRTSNITFRKNSFVVHGGVSFRF